MKTPICLRIDDHAPMISVYYAHNKTGKTKDGREIKKYVPLSFLCDFCDLVEKWNVKGKFSLVPMPGNCGDIVNGIEGVEEADLREWLSIVKKRIAPRFSITPEMLTHNKAVDIKTGESLDIREDEWSDRQDRRTLTPYISKAMSILKEAGFNCAGIESPWEFGSNVLDEYRVSILDSVTDVFGKKKAFYFLHNLYDMPYVNPFIAYKDNDRELVAITSNTHDCIWQTINTTEQSEYYISSVADEWISENGKSGEIITALDKGCMPVLTTHWQSLTSNGLYTGIKVLEKVLERVDKNLSDRVEWMTAEEIMNLVE